MEARELTFGTHMHTTILAAFFEFSRTVPSMCTAGILLFLVALWAAKTDIAQASGLDKIVATSNLCFAVPLAVFGALHLSDVEFVMPMVPSYMPWRLFWGYFFGFALLAASLSIATKIQVRWSGLLFGIAMFLFVAMLDIPGSLASPRDRFGWTLTLREMLFGGGGWILAGNALREQGHGQAKSKLISVGRVVIGIAAIFYGIENSLHTANVPGVPLEKLMPVWIPAHLLIGYLTGAILLIAGSCILLAKKTRMAATYLGTWIVLLVLFIYGPILIVSMADPSTDVKVEGINYFFDTLLFAGAILALARATPRTD
jgi:putative oxidoreductase